MVHPAEFSGFFIYTLSFIFNILRSAKIPIQLKYAKVKAAEFQDVRKDILNNANTLNLGTANSKNPASILMKKKSK